MRIAVFEKSAYLCAVKNHKTVMKLFESIKFWVIAATAMVAFAACDDENEDVGHFDQPETILYQGECIYSASMGKIQWCDTLTGSVSVSMLKGKPVSFAISPIDSLVITPANMVIDKMDSFFIDSIAASETEANKYEANPYIEQNIACTMRGQENIYDATGMVAFVLNQDSIDATYTFKLGRMPLSIQVDFKGKKR